MSRRVTPVDLEKLIEILHDVDVEPFPQNRNDLWNIIATQYNQIVKPNIPITSSIVYQRIRKNNISIRTPIGKRGRALGQCKIKRGKRKNYSKYKDSFECMNEVLKINGVERKYKNLLNRVKKGSMKAAIKLHCHDCVGYCVDEVKNCGSLQCPLYPFRSPQ